MARPLRIEFAGALYHVMARVNERKAIVRDDADRQKWLDWLRRTVETYGYRVTEVALVLGYRSPSSVTRAVARVESSMFWLQETVAELH